MADKKISELTALTTPDGAEELVVNDGGTSKKITIDNIFNQSIDVTGTVTADGLTVDGNATADAFDLSAIATDITDTAVDVFVYDTSKDSDGGAWRKRCQHTSWYNETLNTATRGSRKEFPAVAVIVAESNQVTIYDGDDPALPMWMVFNAGFGSSRLLSLGSGAEVKAIAALNGVVSAGTGGATSSIVYDGLSKFDFVADKAERNSNSGGYTEPTLAGLSHRNADGYEVTTYSERAIVNSTINDVAMTVLPNAPIDDATGLPVPTIAVATDGGLSVITDSGAVNDYSNTSVSVVSVEFIESSIVAWLDDARVAVVFDDYSSDGFAISRDYDESGTINILRSAAPSVNGSAVGVSTGEFALGLGGSDADAGLFKIAESWGHAHTTSSYNTGWMNGDIKLATLSDTDDTDVTGSELVTNGTFDTDTSGWTADSGSTLSISAGELVVTTTSAYKGAYQAVAVEVGRTYTYSVDETAGTPYHKIGYSPGSSGITHSTITPITTFTPTNSTIYIWVGVNVNGAGTATFDNISVRLAEEDRSVNGNGLQVFGTVTKSAVATGADLVAYSGFSASNYLEQPYNSDLDFGTGDFCVVGWFKHSDIASNEIFRRSDPAFAGPYFRLYQSSTGVVTRTSGRILTSTLAVNSGTWRQAAVVRRNGVLELWIDGSLNISGADTSDLTNTSATFCLGNRQDGADAYANGSLALWRISATAPTAEQIAKIYEDEKVLFQENAQATLYGASDAVTALAHDPDTNLLHVGTSAGRSVFQGLRRVSNTTTAVGTAISASNGLIAED